MNQYEINTSGKSKSISNVGPGISKASWKNVDSSNPEYSYAYCEPIIKKINQAPQTTITTTTTTQGKVSNIPTSISNIELCKTHKPPGNSLRALLTKSFRKSSVSHPNERHTFTTNYGKKENIYEDVDRVLGTKPKQSFSSESVGKIPLDEELKFVELQHNRVMNELNLSIEELLMPSQSESDQLDLNMLGYNQMEECCKQVDDQQLKFEMIRRPNKPLFATQIQFNPSFDIDSGISGSSSSAASYAGSVRYRSNFSNQSTSRNTTIYETPGTGEAFHHNVVDQNLSPFHLISDEQANPEGILPYTEQCSSYCCHAIEEPSTHISTNANQSERRIETISEKVILWNKMARIKDTSNSTKCSSSSSSSSSNKHPQNFSHGPT